ncbi:MAG: type IV pilus assembly protein PilM [Lentisphaeria bacterium]|jgi:type IV pilus assembly protein PilM
MAHDRILAIDIGATSIKLCEFEYASGGEVHLALFAHREYEEELSEGTRLGVVAGLLRQMLAEGGFSARKAMICMSGQSALTRFSRLPAMNYDRKQIKQLAEYEAIQNIPFAVSEVIWDYQLIAGENTDNIDVMSVVIKSEIVEQMTAAVQVVGCTPILVDVAPAACYNAVRANGIGDEECVIVLNIGGRSSNLIFAEGDHFFARTIPIAGHAITQQISKEFGIGLPEAEELKRRHGFVALGGAYAEPESETAANVSKIIRNVMARLHGEIARSINVYRAQQKGSRPVKMYLTGGSSILSYCDVFFSEKLGIPVEYLNPFQVVTLLPSVDRNRLQEVAHMFSEAIGLGLRYVSACPIELSLIPESIRRQQNFDKKKPYFVFSMIASLMILGVITYGVNVRSTLFEQAKRDLEKLQIDSKPTLVKIEEARSKAQQKEGQYQAVSDLLLQQAKWPVILNEIYRIKPNNLWLSSIKPIYGEVKAFVPDRAAGAADAAGGDIFGPAATDGGMFGPMMDGPMMGGMGGEVAAIGKMTNVGGLEIVGFSVMPDKGPVSFSIGDEIPLPFTVDKDEASEAAPVEGGEATTPLSNNDKIARAMRQAGSTPELAFEAALRQSQLFSADPQMTVLKVYRSATTARNISAFAIQVKFTMPLEFYEITAGAGRTGAGAGMGGGMMDGGF